ncbi:MAG: biotin--[Kiritimatiellae bacterium]|nr:biotin--[acetyl-CoA-carboxylase] ligase [Kiritimatiellia bacterium]
MNPTPGLVRLAQTDSTNSRVLELGRAGAPAWTAVVADSQTAGRGRSGAAWVSPPGVALYFSVLLRPALAPDALPLATLAAGVAVAEAVRAQTGLPAGLKWPNDLLVRGRKAAGILCEAETGPGGEPFVAAGVGLNVNTPPALLPPRPLYPATSLAAEAGRDFDREALLLSCLAALRRAVRRLEAPGGAAATVARFNELDALRGAPLRVALPDGTVARGTCLGAAPSGALLLDTPAGPREILAGSVA